MAKLTVRQAAFVQEYLIDLNATQAAIRAGYSPRGATVQGSRLLADANIASAIQEAQADRSQRTCISQDLVLQELQKLAFGDPRDLMSWGAGGVKLKESVDLTPDQAAQVAEISETTTAAGGALKIKRHDKVRALELLGRHLGLFTDKLEHSGPGGGPIQTESRVQFYLPTNGR